MLQHLPQQKERAEDSGRGQGEKASQARELVVALVPGRLEKMGHRNQDHRDHGQHYPATSALPLGCDFPDGEGCLGVPCQGRARDPDEGDGPGQVHEPGVIERAVQGGIREGLADVEEQEGPEELLEKLTPR